MRGGQNKKTIEQHIADGTYRPDRHGLLDTDDSEILKKMKLALYYKFKKIDDFLNKADLNSISKDNVNYYLSIIKTFDSISKNPVKKESPDVDAKMEL
jgi:hypothetical protein